jgi:hypothetical protein
MIMPKEIMTNTNDKQHRSILQRIAHRVMLERGLVPDFPGPPKPRNAERSWKASYARFSGHAERPRPVFGFIT